jgi:hypothetical protein
VKLHHLFPSFFLIAMSSVACSSSSSSDAPAATPCNVDPWQCPAGQTCWLKDNTLAFACLNSAAGKAKGDSCGNTVGSPTCGDGLSCLQLDISKPGVCAPFCDNAKAGRGCAAGETCVEVRINNDPSAAEHLCVGTSTPMDSGTETSTDSGSDSAATDTGGSSDGGGETATDATGD